MKIYYQVRILPALPNHCLVEHDFLSLGKFGFYPENEEDKNEKTTTVFLAPTYVADETDRRYSFVDNEGSFRASPGESGSFHQLRCHWLHPTYVRLCHDSAAQVFPCLPY